MVAKNSAVATRPIPTKEIAVPPAQTNRPQAREKVAPAYPRLETIITSTENSFPNPTNFLAKSSL